MDRLFLNSMEFQLNCPINNKQFALCQMNCQKIVWNPKKCNSSNSNYRDKWKILNRNFRKRNNNFKVFVFNWTVKMKKRNCKIQLNNSKTIWQIKKENSKIATQKRTIWNKSYKKRKMKIGIFKNNAMKVNKERRKKGITIMYWKVNWNKAKKTLNIFNK